eukprot:9038571-Lingulodinium_polyedra.AAC.1
MAPLAMVYEVVDPEVAEPDVPVAQSLPTPPVLWRRHGGLVPLCTSCWNGLVCNGWREADA